MGTVGVTAGREDRRSQRKTINSWEDLKRSRNFLTGGVGGDGSGKRNWRDIKLRQISSVNEQSPQTSAAIIFSLGKKGQGLSQILDVRISLDFFLARISGTWVCLEFLFCFFPVLGLEATPCSAQVYSKFSGIPWQAQGLCLQSTFSLSCIQGPWIRVFFAWKSKARKGKDTKKEATI